VFAREFWKRIEPIHAVTYFAPESTEAARVAGLRGFWMGYFGFRAAPLGRVSAGVVEAAFANFDSNMVRRAIPDAWDFANPNGLTLIRATAAAAALRRIAPEVEQVAMHLNALFEAVIAKAQPIGRPLFAANRGLERLDDPVERFWQNCTTLREHRGDGHVAALAVADIGGCEAHLLLSADHGLPPAVFFDSRGWTPEQQRHATTALQERGLFDGDGITTKGRSIRSRVETTTDALASAPFDGVLDQAGRKELLSTLTPIATIIAKSGTLPFPNPMGLPKLSVA
jgi:hypothetical protein